MCLSLLRFPTMALMPSFVRWRKLTGQRLLPAVDAHLGLIMRLVERGFVDGYSGVPGKQAVDGRPLARPGGSWRPRRGLRGRYGKRSHTCVSSAFFRQAILSALVSLVRRQQELVVVEYRSGRYTSRRYSMTGIRRFDSSSFLSSTVTITNTHVRIEQTLVNAQPHHLEEVAELPHLFPLVAVQKRA